MVELNLNEAAAVLDNLITDALIAYTWTETGMAFTGKAQFLTRMSGSILAAEQLRDRLTGIPDEKQVQKAAELGQAYKEGRAAMEAPLTIVPDEEHWDFVANPLSVKPPEVE